MLCYVPELWMGSSSRKKHTVGILIQIELYRRRIAISCSIGTPVSIVRLRSLYLFQSNQPRVPTRCWCSGNVPVLCLLRCDICLFSFATQFLCNYGTKDLVLLFGVVDRNND